MQDSILLLGATSIVGFNLAMRFPDRMHAFIPKHRDPRPDLRTGFLDLESPAWIRDELLSPMPGMIIYAHAVCNVGHCEANPAWANHINVDHVERVLAALAPGVRFVYVSSDHVFGHDGAYYEGDATCPVSEYGRTRVAAESLVRSHDNSLVIRHGLPIGPSFDGRSGHLDWLRYRSGKGLPLTLVEDEARSAVPVGALCDRIVALSESDASGIRHIPSTRCVERLALARHLMGTLGIDHELQTTRRARRPVPHIGRIEILSDQPAPLGAPLVSVLDSTPDCFETYPHDR